MPFALFSHPVLLAAVAVVAIGVVIYEIVNNQNGLVQDIGPRPPPDDRRPPPPSNNARSPPPSDDRRPPTPPDDRKPPPPSNNPTSPNQTSSKSESTAKMPSTVAVKGPPTPPTPSNDQRSPTAPNHSENGRRPSEQNSPKEFRPIDPPYYLDRTGPSKSNETSSDSKLMQHSNSPVNNLRRRVANQAPSKSESTAKMASTVAVKELNETSTADNQNSQKEKFDESNYCKNVLDKLTSDTKNVNENISGLNIYEEDSDSSKNNLPSKNEEKLINQIKTDEKVENEDMHKKESDSSCSDEDMYKKGSDSLSFDKSKYVKEVRETLKTDVHDSNGNNPVSSHIDSSENIEKEEPTEHNFCKACEERHIDTRANPCNHAYLCVDCAVRIFRIYKKCSICLEEVAEFVQFAL